MALKPDTFHHSLSIAESTVVLRFYNISESRSIYDLRPEDRSPHRVEIWVSNTDLPPGIFGHQAQPGVDDCWVLAWLIRNAVQL